MTRPAIEPDELVALAARLRAVGCVFAEDEAAILIDTAPDAAVREALVRRRETGEPLESIVGWVEFGGVRLRTAPGVFVPRQRSVRIARAAAAAAVAVGAGGRRPVVVEACCGVAPIAATVVAAVPMARVLVFDVDSTAVAAARSNLSTGAEGFVGSTLDVLPPELLGHLDLIAAVPPYVPDGARHLMPHDTLAFEPEAAVLGGDDGLDVARVIITDAARWLAPGGRILLELHRSQVRMAAAHAREHGLRPLRRAVSADAQTGLFEARLGP